MTELFKRNFVRIVSGCAALTCINIKIPKQPVAGYGFN